MTSSDTATPQIRPPRRRRGAMSAVTVVAVMALLAGVAIGRFITFDPGAAAAAPPATPAVALADRVAELERRVAQNPSDLRAWQDLGTTAVQRAAETADPAFYALADGAFDRADQLEADAPETLLGRGALALALHEFDRALVVGRKAVAHLPADAQALGIVVDAQVELGRYDAAAQTLQQMLDVRPGLAALARASYLRQLHGDIDGAHQALRQAELAGSPSPFDQAVVLALQGELLLGDGDVAGAAEAYRRAAELAPTFGEAAVGLARIEAIDGDPQAAVRRLAGLVERAPQPGAAALLAELQTVTGDAAGARDTAEVVRSLAALQEAAGQVVDLEMALFEADAGRADRAVDLARAAYEARPDNVFTADALGWALHRAGDSAAAVTFADQAIRLGTADALLHYHAAQIYAGAGDDEQAATALRTAVDLTPWFSFAAIADATRLAQQLDVEVPDAWRAW